MSCVADVAEYILLRGPLDPWKLQRLVYYAQAWSLLRTGCGLFEDPIEAWATGPVVRTLYNIHRGKYTLVSGEMGGDPGALSSGQRVIVNAIIAHYGGLSASRLSEITQSEVAWQRAREGLAPTERGCAVMDMRLAPG